MQVNRYIFQSPYSSQVQVGRPDPSVGSEQKAQQDTSGLMQSTNTSLQNAQSFQATQVGEVTPTVTSDNLLDIYA